jgi:DNA-binding transcriptional regulator GbsR (MarR family)
MTELTQRFVLHFGEMGSRWGINRTVGQMYAYLVASPTACCAEEMADALQVSRSNVSMGLKELDSWQLLKRSHVPGDRREFYSAHGDAWDIFKRLAEQRITREIAPTLSMLREALMEPATEQDVYLRRRMRDMHDLIERLTGWFADIQRLERSTLERLLSLGSGVVKLLEHRGRFAATPTKPRQEPALGRKKVPETDDGH